MGEARGFIVSAWDEFRSGGAKGGERASRDRVLITGWLEDGRSFAALRASPGPAVFVARELAIGAAAAIGAALGRALGDGGANALAPAEDWSDMGGA